MIPFAKTKIADFIFNSSGLPTGYLPAAQTSFSPPVPSFNGGFEMAREKCKLTSWSRRQRATDDLFNKLKGSAASARCAWMFLSILSSTHRFISRTTFATANQQLSRHFPFERVWALGGNSEDPADWAHSPLQFDPPNIPHQSRNFPKILPNEGHGGSQLP